MKSVVVPAGVAGNLFVGTYVGTKSRKRESDGRVFYDVVVGLPRADGEVTERGISFDAIDPDTGEWSALAEDLRSMTPGTPVALRLTMVTAGAHKFLKAFAAVALEWTEGAAPVLKKAV